MMGRMGMKKAIWAGVLVGVFLLGNVLGSVALSAQAGGPASGAIQLALRRFLATANTWTAVQTFASGTTVASPVFTGQWTVNGSLAAAGQLAQGGNPTVFTASPKFTGILCGTNDTTLTCDPLGWGNRQHVVVIDDGSAGNGQPIIGLVNRVADADLTELGRYDFGATAQSGAGGELAFMRAFTHGATATNRGAELRFTLKANGSSTQSDYLQIDGGASGGTPVYELFNPASLGTLLDMGNTGFGHLVNAISPTGQSALIDFRTGDNTKPAGFVMGVTSTAKWFVTARNNAETPNDRFAIFNSGAVTEVLTILQGGTVGINNANPSSSYILDVVGAVNSTTTYNVGGVALNSGTTLKSAGSGMAVANVGANSCGTTTATIAGNNNAFVITVGATAGTQCRVAFTFAATTEWDCAASDDTTTTAVRTTPFDTTHTDLIGAFTAGDKVTGICFPR